MYALGIHLKLYEISRRYRDAFQSYCRKTKGVGKKNALTAWRVNEARVLFGILLYGIVIRCDKKIREL